MVFVIYEVSNVPSLSSHSLSSSIGQLLLYPSNSSESKPGSLYKSKVLIFGLKWNETFLPILDYKAHL